MTEGWRHVWLPYAQMQTAPLPLPAVRAEGSRIHLEDGRVLIDGIASWWTACHGYNHPHIRAAVAEQLERMPHVMFGGLGHEPAYRLATRLAALMPGSLNRVFFTDSGSVAVEVAIKIAVQSRLNRGERGRTKILAFTGGYHGDTLGTMAICDPEEGMHAMFSGLLPEHPVVPLPRDEASIAAFESFLEQHASTLAAIIVEPLVQGAGGMVLHEPEVLRRLRAAADHYGLTLIFDEIFTGFGRTGTHVRLRAGGRGAGHRYPVQGADRRHFAARRHHRHGRAVRGVSLGQPDDRADARPDLHGQPAGLRRRQCLARSVRDRAAP